MDWDEQFNWSELQHDYTEFNAPLTDNVVQKLQDGASSDQFQERRIPEINIADLNEGQTQFYNILTEILQCKHGKSSTDGGQGFSRLIFYVVVA